MKINIVSRNPHFCRLLELELSRFGLYAIVTDSPAEGYTLCLMDADTCQTSPPSPHTALILFGDTVSDELTRRAKEKLSKPFLLTDLRRAITEQMAVREQPTKKAILKRPARRDSSDRLVIHHKTHSATVGNGEPIALSETEYKLLCRLKEFGAKPLSAKDVTDILGDTESNKFNVYICYLRRKLERGELRLIHTVRGQGYTLYSQERKPL